MDWTNLYVGLEWGAEGAGGKSAFELFPSHRKG